MDARLLASLLQILDLFLQPLQSHVEPDVQQGQNRDTPDKRPLGGSHIHPRPLWLCLRSGLLKGLPNELEIFIDVEHHVQSHGAEDSHHRPLHCGELDGAPLSLQGRLQGDQ